MTPFVQFFKTKIESFTVWSYKEEQKNKTMQNLSVAEEPFSSNMDLIKEWRNSFQFKTPSIYFENECLINKSTKFYVIIETKVKIQKKIGYFAVKNGSEICSYFILTEYQLIYDQKDIFKKFVVEETKLFKIKSGAVLTTDTFFMNTVLDHQKKIFPVGYAPFISIYKEDFELKHKEFDFDEMKLAKLEEKEKIAKAVEGNTYFLQPKEIEPMIKKKQIYYFVEKAKPEIIAIGVIVQSDLFEENWGIGMFVNPKYRRRGIGTYVLKALQKFGLKKKKICIAGCDARNFASRKTITRSGMIYRGSLMGFQM